MTKRQIRLLAYMLVGIYIRIAFPMDIAPGWVNGTMLLTSMIFFWVSYFALLKTD